ncbi:hypothetical protein DL764_003496 [Monosporascus ibericus]|uniref:Exonuclease domain-containing protein n=1 Tax=Monosporascus ibericus TaxID=155417 RepID=A0A4Q4TGA6_9PEZI|nr:hypothetical protein DL764_003496 [Monosporascus ibericus]
MYHLADWQASNYVANGGHRLLAIIGCVAWPGQYQVRLVVDARHRLDLCCSFRASLFLVDTEGVNPERPHLTPGPQVPQRRLEAGVYGPGVADLARISFGSLVCYPGMTGLNPDTDEIIEIFCVVTTGTLEVIDENGWGTVVHQSKERMDMMDEWCTRTHEKSGLTDAVLASKVTPEQAADELLAYIKKHVPEPGALLAGNSVHADRAFLRKEPYKKVMDYLHHRILDVSSLKEAARRWCSPEVMENAPRKQGLHQAKDDILESIAEARYYKDIIFSTTANIASPMRAA